MSDTLSTQDEGPCLSIAVNAQGQIALGTECGSLIVYDTDRQPLLKQNWPEKVISSVRWSSRSEGTLYVACSDSVLLVTLNASGQLVTERELSRGDDEINCIALNDRETRVAAGDDSGLVSVINIEGPHASVKRLRRHSNICSSICFVPHATDRLLSAGLDAELLLWDYARGRVLASEHMTESLNEWHLRQKPSRDNGVGAATQAYLVNPPLVHCLSATSDGKQALCALENGSVAVFSVRSTSLAICHVIENAHSQGVTSLSFMTQPSAIPGCTALLATAGNDSRVCLFAVEYREFIGHKGKKIPPVCHWGKKVYEIEHGSKVNCLNFANGVPDLLVGDQTNQVKRYCIDSFPLSNTWTALAK